MLRIVACVLVLSLSAACSFHPRQAYYPSPTQPETLTISRTLYRAAEAAGDDPRRYGFALVHSSRVQAWNGDDAVLYFSEGLARLPTPHVDALVAQRVGHEILGHEGQRRLLSVSVTAGFMVLGLIVPGLGLLDLAANPLIVRAFTREQELAADQRALEILVGMGHARPRRTLAAALEAAGQRNGPVRGGLLARQPDLGARLLALQPLEPLAGVAARR